ncbi:MAG: hypothetical protein JNG89_10840 [Planctomycetaceae bacterium]|nr:hypothetical protein [Planctomycetaceae bacterium]
MQRVTTKAITIPDNLMKWVSVAEATHLPSPPVAENRKWHLLINGMVSQDASTIGRDQFRKFAIILTDVACASGFLQETESVQVTFVSYPEGNLNRLYRLSFGVATYIESLEEARLRTILDDSMTTETM